jgi:glycosyltransferase involved in cell wall biosynthesis
VRILILNWRDIRSPRAGGAERLTHEIAKRLTSSGHGVTWFASRPQGLPERDEIDGVAIVREGSELTTRFHAIRAMRDARWDVVVEEINTLPYCGPILSRAPVILFIPQLAREVWWYEAPWWLAPLGYLAEPVYLSAYRRTPTVTISRSTVDGLRGLGFESRIHVIPMAADVEPLAQLPPKQPEGRLVAVGRLVPSKRFDHAIRALAAVRARIPGATLTLIGDGPEQAALKRIANEFGVGDAIRFLGRVTEDEKRDALAEGDIVVACSVREGWGLTVTEAARVGTPAVAYDVAGLRDSIVDGRTGVLTAPSPPALAGAIVALVGDSRRYAELRHTAWERAARLSWDGTAASFMRALETLA